MNKFKLWKIETLIEKYFELNFSKEKLSSQTLLLKILKKNYPENKSKYNNDFIFVKRFLFEKSELPVFFGENRENSIDSKKQEQFYGLKKQQIILQKSKMIYLIDNHNKALFSFLETSELFGKRFDIVHIDAHRDDAIFSRKKLEKISWKNINEYLKTSTVSDYLNLAQETNLIGKIFNITQKKEFESFSEGKTFTKKNYILNLDIDIFGPEGDYIDLELKIKTICQAWKNATTIVIATSPGYIHQKYAEKIIKLFLKFF